MRALRAQSVVTVVLGAAVLFTAPVAAQTRYIAFGDSITVGVGDDDSREETGYPPRLEQMLQDAGRDAVVENRGLGAEKTPEGLTRIDEVLDDGGDVLLLMEGSNDVSRRISPETTVFNLDEMAARAEDRGMEVIHATVVPRIPTAAFDSDNEVNQRLNQRIRDLAGGRSRGLADNFEVFSTTPDLFTCCYQQVPTDNVGHPNAAGYDIMADVFFDVIVGSDGVPPVLGITDPRHAAGGVDPTSPIELDVWDFGEGIDLGATGLVVDGTEVTPVIFGDSRRAELRYTPTEPLTGIVSIELRSRDLASPPNSVDREVTHFTVEGAGGGAGDLDGDGRVDGRDLVAFALAFGASRGVPRYDAAADFNADGVIDGTDLAILADNFGRDVG